MINCLCVYFYIVIIIFNDVLLFYFSINLCKKGLDIKGLSKATLEKLIDWGWVKSYKDILIYDFINKSTRYEI